MSKFIPALAALSLIATPALAGDRAQRSVTVSHADLDLNSRAGRDAFNRRLAAATEQVCGSYAGASATEIEDIGLCRNGVRRQVAAQLSARWGGKAVARR